MQLLRKRLFLRAYGPHCIHCGVRVRNPVGWPKFCRKCGRSQLA